MKRKREKTIRITANRLRIIPGPTARTVLEPDATCIIKIPKNIRMFWGLSIAHDKARRYPSASSSKILGSDISFQAREAFGALEKEKKRGRENEQDSSGSYTVRISLGLLINSHNHDLIFFLCNEKNDITCL